MTPAPRAIVLATATLLVPALALAADTGDIQQLEQARISLVKAIHIAEEHQGGKAIEAGLDDDSFQPAYEVSIVKDGRIYDVQVDGVSGSVSGTREDIDD